MHTLGSILYVLGSLYLLGALGMENCTQGATDKVFLGVMGLCFLGLPGLALFYLSRKKHRARSIVSLLPVVLFSLLWIILGGYMTVLGKNYYFCEVWPVSAMVERHPMAAWYGRIILFVGVFGVALSAFLWRHRWILKDRFEPILPVYPPSPSQNYRCGTKEFHVEQLAGDPPDNATAIGDDLGACIAIRVTMRMEGVERWSRTFSSSENEALNSASVLCGDDWLALRGGSLDLVLVNAADGAVKWTLRPDPAGCKGIFAIPYTSDAILVHGELALYRVSAERILFGPPPGNTFSSILSKSESTPLRPAISMAACMRSG